MTQQCSGILTGISQTPKNPHTELFKRIVRDSGIKLVSSEEPNVITQEQALVVRDIEKFLEAEEGEDSVDKFLRGFKLLIKKEKYLKKALLPTLFKKSNQESPDDMQIQQESLFRIFLKVTHLQPQIIEILLDELTSAVSEDENDVTHLRLILNQLRYLPHIQKPQDLTSKLLDIIDIAPYPSQLDILDSIPEVLPDSEYNETANELTQMLEKNDELCGAIVDCLNALNLSSEIRGQIQDHILSKILMGASPKVFPVFLDFLLSEYNAKTLGATLIKIRNAVNVLLGQDKSDKEKESVKIVIVTKLQKSAVLKVVSDSWVATISGIKTHTDHKPVDLIILFMLHANAKMKKRNIETLVRKKVKDGQFKCQILEQLFEKYFPQQLLRDYFTSIVEIGASLLRGSENPILSDFASTLFKLLFSHEYLDQSFRQEILENMILLVGASDQKNVTIILNIIFDLLEEIGKAPNHAIILMKLLEKVDSFELKDVRLIFEILCRLTCHEDSLLGLKEELHMIIRKYLSSAKRDLKYRGIIAAVVMAKNIATNSDESDFSMEESINLTQLKGAAKDAASILELTNTSAANCPELISLYYDQLASMIFKSSNLDRQFMAWLYETVTNDFQYTYVTESICDDFNDLKFTIQFNLNSTEEVDSTLAVNIAELTLKSENRLVLVLAPHFRLLRLLHHQVNSGDLSSIDALLGCGVVLPQLDERDSLGLEQLKQLTDCVFHCINWFREIISGFVIQKGAKLRQKVIQRIVDLQELEKLFGELLEMIPNHKLPTSYNDVLSPAVVSPVKEKIKAPRKKLKVREAEETVASTSKVKKNKDEPTVFKFREIDVDCVKLLKYPLDFESSSELKLTLKQFNFVLKDFVTKLTLITQRRDIGLSHLYTVTAEELVKDCTNVLPHLNAHLKSILTKIEEEEVGVAFGLILECLLVIFGWSGLQHIQKLDLLRDLLKSFRQQTSTPLNSVNLLVVEFVERLSEYTDYCSGITQGVDLIKLLETLYSLNPNQSIRSKIAKTASKLLNKDWTGSSANVDVLIRAYLSSANVKSLCGMVGTLQEEAPSLVSKSDCLEMLKSVTKSNFYVLYRNLWSCLHERVKVEIQSLTNSQHLTLWRTVALTMQGLMTVVKSQETKFNLVCFLKKSIAILKIFLSHGIPIIEIELKKQPDRVVEILKTVQSNTRFLHHLCCYSKLTKDASLMAYVPQFRLTLETLIYRVKAALVANGCSEAFWMGNLKNRDLQGEDILTQTTDNSTQAEEEEEDEAMPSDEDLEEESEDFSHGSEVL